jgi:hypothetical protein
MSEEEYREIPNFKGYAVSNMGNIKSYKRGKEGGAVLKTIVGSRGYPRFFKSELLTINNKGIDV